MDEFLSIDVQLSLRAAEHRDERLSRLQSVNRIYLSTESVRKFFPSSQNAIAASTNGSRLSHSKMRGDSTDDCGKGAEESDSVRNDA